MHQKFYLLTVFIFFHFFSSAQHNAQQLFKRCPVKTINYEQGLLNNATTGIITDALGFTWISTKTGMQRYNGYVLETINPVINKEIMSIHSPVYFFALKNGLIWISYKQGVLEYDARTNSFKKIISIQDSVKLNFSLIPVMETNEGIWCLQQKKGLVIYSIRGALVKKVSADENAFIENVFNQQEVFTNTTFAVNQHSIFIYDGKDKILQVNTQTYQFSYISAINIYNFTCSNKNLYIISNKGLTGININNKKIVQNVSFKNITGENINSSFILLFDNSQLLIGLNNHLYQVDSNFNYLKEFTNFNQDPVVPLGFIITIYADRFKRIWLLTNDDIKRIQNVDIPFKHFIYSNGKNNFVRSLYYDEKKHLLLAGCLNGGIQLYDTLGNALWRSALISKNVKDINAIEKLSNDNYFIETIGNGWYVLNLPSKKTVSFLLTSSLENQIHSHATNFINNIQRINDSTLFIATNLNVLDCVFKNGKLKSVQPLLYFNDALSTQVSCFIYTTAKTLWAGTIDGIIYKQDENKQLQTLHIPENYQVRSFAEDAEHNVWVGTDKGLFIYAETGLLIKTITTQSGLLNDCIYALLPVENKAAVFASSNLGLSYVSLNGKIFNYTKESGLQENEFNTESAIKTSLGKFYFGGVNGITSFYPASLSAIKDSPVLNITKLVINDSLYNALSLLKNNSIKLKYNQNHIQLDFAATGLLNTNEYKYQYRLKGFGENWQTTHQPTGIKYVLQPGDYLFEITCAPILSSNSIFTKTIAIIISPPWWQAWSFKILSAIILISIIAFIVQQYLRRQYQKRLSVLQMQQQLQEERERISRDLHDNLGAYAAAIASNVATINNIQSANDTNVLQQLKINSQSIINQLNDTIWALNKEAITLTAVSDRFKIFLQKIRQSYPVVNIAIRENIVQDELLSPVNALHLFRIMQETVNNALKHSDGNDIFIELISDKKWVVIIKDNGRGMPEDEKILYGNGLNNIKTRSNAAGWDVQWISEPQNGTEVIISSTAN